MPRAVGSSAARDGGGSNARTLRYISSLPFGGGVWRVRGFGVGFSILEHSVIHSDIAYVLVICAAVWTSQWRHHKPGSVRAEVLESDTHAYENVDA